MWLGVEAGMGLSVEPARPRAATAAAIKHFIMRGLGFRMGRMGTRVFLRKGDTQRLTLLVDTAQRFILAKIMVQYR